ncbi:hypothetical protein M422DRAFT_40853 [Sphaerobolus stellatus SS14]|nr:hypothetical protein M422DRAFT_40853 [Sphaerobolus stellatus SS14]
MDLGELDPTYQPSDSDSDILSDTSSDAYPNSCVDELESEIWIEFNTVVEEWWMMMGGLNYPSWLVDSESFGEEVSSQHRGVRHLLEERMGRLRLANRLLCTARVLTYSVIDFEADENVARTMKLFQITYVISHILHNQVAVLKSILLTGNLEPYLMDYGKWWGAAVSYLIQNERK